MFQDVEMKLKKGNKILFSRDSLCLQDLIKLINSQNHRTLILWAQDAAKQALNNFEEKYPQEYRPRKCLELCEKWAKGEILMPLAKRAILDAHAVAKEINDSVYGALCHAIGHAGATVHVKTHALGLPFYELTAIVLQNKNSYKKAVIDKINYYIARLLFFQENIDKFDLKWALFIK